MATFWEFVSEQRRDLPILATTENCGGGTFIVTGANVGLGFETAKHLVCLKAGKVILACRNAQAGEKAKSEIEAATNCPGIAEVWQLDLASYDSVKSFANRAIKDLGRIDGLIENAGIALDTWSLAEGHETSVTVNIISTFLLAVLLHPKMTTSARQLNILPHIVIVTSGAAFMMNDSELEKVQDDPFVKMDDQKASDMTKRYSSRENARWPIRHKLILTFLLLQISAQQARANLCGDLFCDLSPNISNRRCCQSSHPWSL